MQLHIMKHDAYAVIQGKLRNAGIKDAPGFRDSPRAPLCSDIPQRSVDARIVFEDHLAFACPDMKQTREQLRSLGIAFHDAKSRHADHLWILDPDGRTIELTEDAKPPPPRPVERHQEVMKELSRL
uniref:VOC domain-containing protein n=1 Tax=Alexandrium andersonii TaxID=327968 RepID=A0A7S2F5I7_9DINO